MPVRQLALVLAAAAFAVAVAAGVALTGDGGPWWALLGIGAGYALALWGILFAGSYAARAGQRRVVTAPRYLLAAVVALALGAVFASIGGSGVWWAPGVIVAGLALVSRDVARAP